MYTYVINSEGLGSATVLPICRNWFSDCSHTHIRSLVIRVASQYLTRAGIAWSVMLGAGWSWVLIPIGVRDFSLLQSVQTGSRVQLDSYSVGTGDSCPEVQWLGHKVDL